jgi:WD40 repeat protein
MNDSAPTAATRPVRLPTVVAALLDVPMAGGPAKMWTALVLTFCLIAGAGLFAYQGSTNRPASAGSDKPAGRPAADTPESPRTDRYGDPLPRGAIQRLGTIRFHSGAPTNCLAISPDGQTIVSGGMGVIRFWDAATGKPGATLIGHKSHVFSLAFSADGRRLASAGAEHVQSPRDTGKLIIWDVAAKRPLVTVDHPGWIRQVDFSRDGKRVAMSCDDGTLDVLDADTGTALHHLGRAGRFANTVAFSPGGRFVGGGGDKNDILLWDVETGQEHLKLTGPNRIRSLAFSRDGKTLATAHDGEDFPATDAPICLWDLKTGQKRQALHGLKGMVFRVAFSPDGKHLAGGGMDGTVLLWDVASGKLVHTFKDIAGWMHGVAFTPDGRRLVAAGSHGRIRVWETATGKAPTGMEDLDAGLSCIAVSPDARMVAAGGDGRPISIWDVASGRRIVNLPESSMPAWSLAFAPTAMRLASAGRGDAVHIWDVSRYRQEQSFKGPVGSWDSRTSFSPTGRLLAASHVGIIRLMDPATGKELRTLKGHAGYVLAMAFSPNEKLLLSASHAYSEQKMQKLHDDFSVRVWDVVRGEEMQRFENLYPQQPAFHPDGRMVAFLSQGRMICRDALTGRERPSAKETDITAFAFSPDGNWLATAHGHGTIRIREQPTRKEVLRFDASPNVINHLTWTTDGKRLISGNNDQTALVWDLSPPAWNSRRPTRNQFEQAWADLASSDASRAYQAVWTLVEAGGIATELLEDRLQPASAARTEQIRRLIGDLDDDSFAKREAASRQLAQFGAAAEPALADALANHPSPEVRTRIEALLRQSDGAVRPVTPEQMQISRGLIVLERIGNDRSQRLLQRLAGGAVSAWQTATAKRGLERLLRRRAAAQAWGSGAMP